MQFSIMPQLTAPLTTGHPLGLPSKPKPAYTPTRVAAIGGASTGSTTGGQSTGVPPQQSWRTQAQLTGTGAGKSGEQAVAPPSIMQIKISQLLTAQAARMADDQQRTEDPDSPQPDPAQQEQAAQAQTAISEEAAASAERPALPAALNTEPEPAAADDAASDVTTSDGAEL